MSKFILLTGGGTAGHVTPNIALIPRLRAAGHHVEYVGTSRGIEHHLIEPLEVPFHTITAGKLRRYFSWHNLTDIFRIKLGFLQALLLMFRCRPDILFSKGGFVAAPVVWAAWLFRVPIVIHESDLMPGLANRLSIPFAQRVCYSFRETADHLPAKKAIYTGIPVREELLKGDPDKGREILRFEENKPVLLVIGGSLGSQAINRAVRQSLEELLKSFNIVHICGTGNKQETLLTYEGYRQYEYVSDPLKHFFAATTLVISRAGATMLFELLALRKPHLLIPLSKKASRGDQMLNAASFEKLGYSMVLQEERLGKKTLLQSIRQLYEARDDYIDRLQRADEGQALHRVLQAITTP